MTAFVERSGVRGPTAGSDQVKPTVFSAVVAVDFRSPYSLTFPPEVASVTAKLAEYAGLKLE
jgi:hypothetical protein